MSLPKQQWIYFLLSLPLEAFHMSKIIQYIFFFCSSLIYYILSTVCSPSFLYYFVLILFIYFNMCSCMCVCTWVHVHMCVLRCWDEMTMTSIFVSHSPFYFWDWVSLNLEMTHLAWLTSQQAPGISAQALMLVQQVLYQLSHFPSFSIYVLLCLTSSPSIMVLSLIHAMNHYLYIF